MADFRNDRYKFGQDHRGRPPYVMISPGEVRRVKAHAAAPFDMLAAVCWIHEMVQRNFENQLHLGSARDELHVLQGSG